jgi:hypothetical protein
MASIDGVTDATSKYWLETLPPSIMNTVLPARAPLTLIDGASSEELVPRLIAPGTSVAN